MGGQESKSREYEEAVVLFSEGEQNKMSEMYEALCQNPRAGITLTDLKGIVGGVLPDHLSEHLYLYMKGVIPSKTQPPRKVGISKDELVVSLASLLKGSPEQKAGILCCLACGDHNGPAEISQLDKVLKELLNSYKITLENCESYKSWTLPVEYTTNHLTRCLLHDLIHRDGSKQCDHPEALPIDMKVDAYDIEPWLSRSALILHILQHVFHTCFPVTFMDQSITSLVPLTGGIDWQRFQTVLDLPSLLYLNHCLLPESQCEWRLLYSSVIHGESFHTMTKRIMGRGPSVLVIRDRDGHVFGAHNTESWNLNANFVGNDQCFLFGVHPILDVYPASGYNEHYIYLNQGQETLPNGMGFGGQFGYHGLWLNYEFDGGNSKAQPKCTTYNSPQLSCKESFLVDVIEIWGVGKEKKNDALDAEAKKTGSILDKDPEAKAMLRMIDKGPVSEGLRDGDAQADIPEEHNLGPIGR